VESYEREVQQHTKFTSLQSHATSIIEKSLSESTTSKTRNKITEREVGEDQGVRNFAGLNGQLEGWQIKVESLCRKDEPD
jgi:hypothetical protein